MEFDVLGGANPETLIISSFESNPFAWLPHLPAFIVVRTNSGHLATINILL